MFRTIREVKEALLRERIETIAAVMGYHVVNMEIFDDEPLRILLDKDGELNPEFVQKLKIAISEGIKMSPECIGLYFQYK